MNRPKVGPAAACVVLLVVCTAACTDPPVSSPKPALSSAVPVDAAKAVTNVVSQDPAVVRDSVARSLVAQVSAGTLAPPGTRVAVQSNSWQQNGVRGHLLTTITVPHHSPVTAVFYLVREEGRWRVLFTDAP